MLKVIFYAKIEQNFLLQCIDDNRLSLKIILALLIYEN